uniref:aminotransferase class I/II-fold pyridoxal phosphate-dependent enzyme n=1 Tax=Herbidospora sakaeratensis TaxID=564415 RepID=UPI000781DAD7|nr:aminotransferase class I/II-fold pyridoxal phosphate-dependent enzyme [Herbidospora sakaeratensis]
MPLTLRDPTRRQGGDLRDLGDAVLDLSTCVNRYGPPPAVGAALNGLDARHLMPHPYEAERLFTAACADHLGLPEEELVAGRGITEFIRLLGQVLPAGRTAVVTPDYTDTIRVFPRHVGPPPGLVDTVDTRLDRIDLAMSRFSHVVVSNPNNPLGLHVPPARLAEVCARHPGSTLVVDEAYIEFTADGARGSTAWSGARNLVVLMSPNKPFGIAGTRTGIMWTPSAELRERIRRRQMNWPISYLDALVAAVALASTGWLADTRARLLRTARRMDALLAAHLGPVVAAPVHYRFVPTADAAGLHARLLRAGVAVRAFDGAEPGRVPGLRITAPTESELPLLAAALRESGV